MIAYGRKGQVSYRLKSITSVTKSAVYRRYGISNAEDGGMSKTTTYEYIVYTPFNKVQSITQADKKLTIEYGPDQQRAKTIYTCGETKEVRVYAGDFERLTSDGTTVSYQHIYSPDGLAGICVKMGDAPAEIHYAATDHLGSLLALFKADSAQTYSASYDAWGQRALSSDSISLRRGYCLHEHWPEFGLIDMNGRFYDPQLGRFLSPDPYVQDLSNPQNLNRYSYCLNNPLKYTDPTGEFFHIIIGAAIGGAVNLISGLVSHKVDNVGKGFAYFGIGALAGAASAAVGGGLSSAMAGTGFSAGFTGSAAAASATSCFASGAAIGGACGAVSGSVTGLGNTLVDGGGIGRAVGQMHLQGLIDGSAGAVVGGVAGGINAVRDGRNFWHGGRVIREASIDLPRMCQVGELDCRYEVFRSNDKYFNGSTESVESLRTNFSCVESSTTPMKEMYKSKGLSIRKLPQIKDNIGMANELIDQMQNNKSIIGEILIGPKQGHAMGLTNIRIYNNGRVFIKAMNPSGEGGRCFANFNRFFQFFSVSKS
ncbi:MAG: RHS repeat domain-containing protein [Marinilabiliaceae bacterium]